MQAVPTYPTVPAHSNADEKDPFWVQKDAERAAEAARQIQKTVNAYCAFIKGFSFSGKFPSDPEEIFTHDCERSVNGWIEQRSRNAFLNLLNDFYKRNGAWVVKFKETSIDPKTCSAKLKVTVNSRAVSYDETLELTLYPDFKINHIRADFKPRREKPTLKVGMDTFLHAPATEFAATGFKDFFCYTREQTEAFRKKAISYYTERFGIDTSQMVYNEKNGEMKNPQFWILPVTYWGSYEVTESLSNQIPAEINGVRTKVQIAEYVLVCLENTSGTFYGGTYSPERKIPINPGERISFGKCRLVVGDGRTFEIDMQSRVPNKVISPEGHVLVKLALQSNELGCGTGAYVALLNNSGEVDGLYKEEYRAFVEGNWHFNSPCTPPSRT